MLRLIRLFAVIALALSVILFATMRPAQADKPGVSDAFSITTNDGLSLTLSEDGQVVTLAMDGDPLPITPAPALWVRDMSAAGHVSEPNLLTNPGFEDGVGWLHRGGEVIVGAPESRPGLRPGHQPEPCPEQG
jgi:hypothetical protein